MTPKACINSDEMTAFLHPFSRSPSGILLGLHPIVHVAAFRDEIFVLLDLGPEDW